MSRLREVRLQVLAQVAVGGTIGGYMYWALYGKKQPPRPSAPPLPVPPELEAEIQNTTGLGVCLKHSNDGGIFLQPYDSEGEKVETVVVNLAFGNVTKCVIPKIKTSCVVVPGVLGIVKLKNTAVLITIEEAQQVATLHGVPIFQILKTEVHLPDTKLPAEERGFVTLLREGTDPNQYGRGLFFSYRLNLTLTSERAAAVATCTVGAAWKLEDQRFFWNMNLTEPIMQLETHALVLPVIQGFVSEKRNLRFDGGRSTPTNATLTLIARRSVKRLGTRQWRRGIDHEGSVANFVETEQIITFSAGDVCSFVQLRGSIPVYWTNIPNIKYKPPIEVSLSVHYDKAFEKHITQLLRIYKECVAVNLAHETGSEGKLTTAFDQSTQRFTQTNEGLKLISFDFHKICGTSSYHRLSILTDQIHGDLERFGQFSTVDGTVERVQQGVFRTNCVDCLDRTNIVQTVFSRHALELCLKRRELLRPNGTLQADLPDVEDQFKIIWADHGDEISLQYTGTGALKSGFTRTGKRTVLGMIDDGIKSTKRYYLNNFEDGRKQDALDLVSGSFSISQDTILPDFQRSPDILIYTLLTLIVFGISRLMEAVTKTGVVDEERSMSLWVGGGCLIAAFVIGKFIFVQNGSLLVCKPRLKPCVPKQW